MAIKYSLPFKDHGDQKWRIDIADNLPGNADPVFNYVIDQSDLPLVKAGLSIQDTTTGQFLLATGDAGTGSITIPHGHTYRIQANMNNAPSGAHPRMVLNITENNVLIFDKSLPAPNPGAQIIKTGLAIPGYIYNITVTGDHNATQVTPVDDPSDPSGIPVKIKGAGGKAGVIVWKPEDYDDPFSVYKSSTLTVNCLQEGQINIFEFQTAQDRQFIVSVYRNGQIYWRGFLIPDAIQYDYKSTPFNFSFTAICGLTMLTDIPYVHTDLPGTTSAISRCPINFIRNVLFNNLGNIAPIRWTNMLRCTAFELEDVFAGSVQWAADGQALITYNTGQNDGDESIPQTCDYILKGILQAMQCCIYFDNGRWNIRRILDISKANVPVRYVQIAGDLNIMVLNSSTENLVSQIGRSGYRFINEDQIITVRPGLKSCIATYAANVRTNILPNGTQDLQNPPPQDGPLYWNIYNDIAPFTISSAGSLDRREGFCTNLIFQGILGDPDEWFTMYTSPDNPLGRRGLPVDTRTMVPYIIFGFQFSIKSGFHLTGDGFIDWTGDPLRIKVIYNAGGMQYFLNAQGFWVFVDTYIAITVDNLSPDDVAQIDFNKFQNIPIPFPPGEIVAGYESNIQVLFRIAPDQIYDVDNIYLNINAGNETYISTSNTSKNTKVDKRTLSISSGFGGYQLSNFMTSPFNSGDECYYRDASIYEGTLTGLTANAIMRCCYKPSRIFNGSIYTKGKNWNFDSTYVIDGFASSVFMPLGADYNIEVCQVNNLMAIEIRNDSVDLTEKFYNSNDNQQTG